MANLRTQTATNTSTGVSVKGSDVITLNIVNRHSAAIFVKFYDLPVATFQDTPYRTYQVGANLNLTLAGNERYFPVFSTSNGLCLRVVTGATDSDNTAAATLPIIEMQYNPHAS